MDKDLQYVLLAGMLGILGTIVGTWFGYVLERKRRSDEERQY